MNQALIELKDIGLTLPSQAGDVEILRAGLLGTLARTCWPGCASRPAHYGCGWGRYCAARPDNGPESLENRARFTDIPT